jgi:hypothetical protein
MIHSRSKICICNKKFDTQNLYFHLKKFECRDWENSFLPFWDQGTGIKIKELRSVFKFTPINNKISNISITNIYCAKEKEILGTEKFLNSGINS